MTAPDVTLGEVARRVDRVETEMRTGFREVKEEIARLSFVPAAVYAADRSADAHRLTRLEDDLEAEKQARQSAEQSAAHRGWQARLSLGVAMMGIVLSPAAAFLAAKVVAG